MFNCMNSNPPIGPVHAGVSEHPGSPPSGTIGSATHYFQTPTQNPYGQAERYDPSWEPQSQQYSAEAQPTTGYTMVSYMDQVPAMAQERPKLTTSFWEDQGTLCFQVDARGICVARRQDNDMINGTKLLNVTGISRGKRDGILKNEKGRVVVKVGAMHLKGVWITMPRAKALAAQFGITKILYPLFEDNVREFTTHFANTQLPPIHYMAEAPMTFSSQFSSFYLASQYQGDSGIRPHSPFHHSSVAAPHTFQVTSSAVQPSLENTLSPATQQSYPGQDESWALSPYTEVTCSASRLDETHHPVMLAGNQSSIISDSAPATPDVSMMQLYDQSSINFQPIHYASPSQPSFATDQASSCNQPQQSNPAAEYHFYRY